MSQPDHPFGPEHTPFQAIGGESEVRRLVDAFYDRVATDSPVMKEMHPADLTESREKLYEFLVGWMGGPPLYMQKRGHPRLRMRHAPFPIDDEAVSEWLRCMEGAMDDVGVEGELRAFLTQRFTHTAHFMKNRES
jgi:hemoglobin